MKKKFRGKAEKGRIILQDQKTYDLLVWSLEGKEVEVTLGKKTKQRSNPQNRYFHGVIIPMISEETGYEKDEVKEMLRGLFLSYEITIADKPIKIGKSTASLNTVEFEEFNSECRRWASKKIGLYIPEPNEIEY